MDDTAIIKAFLRHEAINQSYIIEKLWGSREGKYRTRLSKILKGTHRFRPEELEKLKTIRIEIVTELLNS